MIPESCFEQSPDGYLCTLSADHDGDHAAQGADDRIIWSWPNDGEQ